MQRNNHSLQRRLAESNQYMIVEDFIPEKTNELYNRFYAQELNLPNGVSYLDSWINEDIATCYQIMESTSLELITNWLSTWNTSKNIALIPLK